MDVYSPFMRSTDNPPYAMDAQFFGSIEGLFEYGDHYYGETSANASFVFSGNSASFKSNFGDSQFCAPPSSSLMYPPTVLPVNDLNHFFPTTISDPQDLSIPDWSPMIPSLDSSFENAEGVSPISTSDASSFQTIATEPCNYNLSSQEATCAKRMENPPQDVTSTTKSCGAKSKKKHQPAQQHYDTFSTHEVRVSSVLNSSQTAVVVKKRRGRPRVENTELRQARHRERNRLAASRCRVKQRRRTNELEVKAEEMKAKNAQLLKLKDELREQVLRLQADVLEYKNGCECRLKRKIRGNTRIVVQTEQATPELLTKNQEDV